jgi:hypothetical protein
VVEDLEEPGLFALARAGAPEVELCRFGVRFEDARESDLSGASSGTRASSTARADLWQAANPLAAALALAALATVIGDWWVLARRRRAVAGR